MVREIIEEELNDWINDIETEEAAERNKEYYTEDNDPTDIVYGC